MRFALLVLCGLSTVASAETYRTPPSPLADMLDRAPTPAVSIDPTNNTMLLLERPAFHTLHDLSQPELGLAGDRINPKTNGPSRDRYFTGMKLLDIGSGKEASVQGLPKSGRFGSPEWSSDGKYAAFTTTGKTGIALVVLDVAKRQARRVTPYRLNGAAGSPCYWSGNTELLCAAVVPGRGPAPEEATLPKGPVVRESTGRKAPARTYTYLLKNSHDEALFDHYFASRLVYVGINGKTRWLKRAGLFVDSAPSPDGKYILVQEIKRPYSHLVPMSRFPTTTEIWDRRGKVVKVLAEEGLKEEVPIAFGSVPTGKRRFAWRADVPAEVYWVEAQDGGDAGKKADIRDRVRTLAAPFSQRARTLIDLKLRFGGIVWGKGNFAIAQSWWWKTRRQHTIAFDPGTPGKEKVLFDRSFEDSYGDPGSPLTESTTWGTRTLKFGADGKSLFLSGAGASPKGNRPFVDQYWPTSGKTERLWQSAEDKYEGLARMVSPERFLISRETKTVQPNYFAVKASGDSGRQITKFPHPHPELEGIGKQLLRYKRRDGVKLTAKLYTPPGWTKKDGRLPVVLWAYPREFKSAAAASQLNDSPNRFARIGWWSSLVWLTRGYAVLDGATMPIVGEGKREPNDTYVKQLVASAKAAIDEAVKLGVADRKRVAVGGHSYGAFMTANLLAHSDLFAAGIARSGAYNRTLTPFGFQSEERSFWEASKTYFAMSPFMHAPKINEPLLLIHGQADPNSGTYPMQSERLYNAIKGLGGKARLVLLPFEGHGYRARSSIMHMLWETDQWLDKYVKQPQR